MNQNDESKKVDLLLGDLSEVGEELSPDEFASVSGARQRVTWTSGSPARADEWTP